MTTSILIVVPTLNSFELLPRLVESLKAQDWTDWRLLFVDGMSCPRHCSYLDRVCNSDHRFDWVSQDPSCPGIFGAMNLGFSAARSDDWILFWGSDDWAASPNVFRNVVSALELSESQGITPDLLVCRGRYVDLAKGRLSRATVFKSNSLIGSAAFRRSLWLGSSLPHQATFFGPGARIRICSYAPFLRLAADLDYFLRLSRFQGLLVRSLDLELVHMSDSGVSAKQTRRRITEVCSAYRRAFGCSWLIPFIGRYIIRLLSIIRP